MPKLVTSKDNPLLRTVRLVAKQSRRAPPGIVLAEGLRTLEEATNTGWKIEVAIASETFGTTPREENLLEVWKQRGIELVRIPEPLLRSISEVESPQGALALIRVPAKALSDYPPGRDPLILVIDGIQDPGNLGTLIRTAAAADCAFVCCTEGTVSARNPKAIRSSAGAYFRIPPIESVSPGQVLSYCSAFGIHPYRTCVNAGQSHTSVDLKRGIAILLGNEAGGLPSDPWREIPEVRIPMAPEVESLNVAIAGGILLFEARRQRLPGNNIAVVS